MHINNLNKLRNIDCDCVQNFEIFEEFGSNQMLLFLFPFFSDFFFCVFVCESFNQTQVLQSLENNFSNPRHRNQQNYFCCIIQNKISIVRYYEAFDVFHITFQFEFFVLLLFVVDIISIVRHVESRFMHEILFYFWG